jgi:hypothetical protein
MDHFPGRKSECVDHYIKYIKVSKIYERHFSLLIDRYFLEKHVSSITLPAKAFAMDFDPTHSRMVVATAGRRICFLDIRSSKAELVLDRESSLKYQTLTVKFFPQGVGIALGSIEGRVTVEFLHNLGIQSGTHDSYIQAVPLYNFFWMYSKLLSLLTRTSMHLSAIEWATRA